MGVDPVSLGFMAVSAAAGIAGSATAAEGQRESGRATQQAEAYQAQVATNNAAIAETNAREDIQAGEVAATNVGLKTKAAVGSEIAQQGAGGIQVNSGSAADVRAGTAEIGMLDALTVRSNSAKQAYGERVTAASDTAQGVLDTMQGTAAEKAGEIGADATLLSGASTVAGNFAKWQTQFGPKGSTAPIGAPDPSAVDLMPSDI